MQKLQDGGEIDLKLLGAALSGETEVVEVILWVIVQGVFKNDGSDGRLSLPNLNNIGLLLVTDRQT